MSLLDEDKDSSLMGIIHQKSISQVRLGDNSRVFLNIINEPLLFLGSEKVVDFATEINLH